MRAPRLVSFFFVLVLAASCGGKIDGGDGDGGGGDAGGDATGDTSVCAPLGAACNVSVDCCKGACVAGSCSEGPPPSCLPDGAKCSTAAECCSPSCVDGVCGLPEPPPCKPDGVPCQSAGECCSSSCTDDVCGGTVVIDGGVSCASSSTKKCDQCVASFCCQEMIDCGNETSCSSWLACVQSCEQKGGSAFACTQNGCGGPPTPTSSALYGCAQQDCATQCTAD